MAAAAAANPASTGRGLLRIRKRIDSPGAFGNVKGSQVSQTRQGRGLAARCPVGLSPRLSFVAAAVVDCRGGRNLLPRQKASGRPAAAADARSPPQRRPVKGGSVPPARGLR